MGTGMEMCLVASKYVSLGPGRGDQPAGGITFTRPAWEPTAHIDLT